MKGYCVIIKSGRHGGESFIARDIESLAEAGELALRLTRLQESELGGTDEFYVRPE